MKNVLSITAIATCALFAAAVHADDATTAQKAANAPTVNKNVAQPAAGTTMANQKGMAAAEGAHDSTANTGMKASGTQLNKSEGANDLHN